MSKKVNTRKCVICGKSFVPKAVNATVCSEKCRRLNKAKRDKARKIKAKTACKKVVKAKCVEKIAVKKPAKKRNIVTVKYGDAIRMTGFTPKTAIVFAMNILGEAFSELNCSKK